MNTALVAQNRDIFNSLLSENQEIGILIGSPADLDKIAAAVSLSLSLQAIGKNVQVIAKDDVLVDHSVIVGVDKIKKSFEGVTRIFTISVPYREGEIEKVSYKDEGDRLHLNLFAGENGIGFTEKDLQYIKQGSSPSLIIAMGIASIADLQSQYGIDPNVRLVNIDTNPRNELYGDVVYVDPAFSSFSEIVASIIMEGMFPTDIDIAQNLLDGIVFATQNFNNPATSSLAFEAAAFTIKSGAKRGRNERQKRSGSFPTFDMKPEQPAPLSQPFNFPRPLNQPGVNPKPFQPMTAPAQPQPVEDFFAKSAPAAQNVPNPSESSDDIPEDWLAPKVFKSTRTQ